MQKENLVKKYNLKKPKKTELSKDIGVNIDKNEFYEIIKSNSNHPENLSGK